MTSSKGRKPHFKDCAQPKLTQPLVVLVETKYSPIIIELLFMLHFTVLPVDISRYISNNSILKGVFSDLYEFKDDFGDIRQQITSTRLRSKVFSLGRPWV